MTNEEYYKYLQELGHELKLNDYGEIDIFGLDFGYHNGPACVKCYSSWCHHCQEEAENCKSFKG